MSNREALTKHLIENGLYDPAFEHDACGVGLVAAIDGQPRREIVVAACEALKAVWHRGAVDADGKTGDGAGIHLQISRPFFEKQLARMGRAADASSLAVGMMFLPKKNLRSQEECRTIIETEIGRMGYTIYGWRRVPINPSVIGEIANESRPEIEQVILGTKTDESIEIVERNLYVVRRRIERALRERSISDCYISSLSCRSIIYKGLFKAEQLTEFYPDLLDEDFISNYAIFHQRFSTNTAPAWALAQPFRTLAHNGEINTIKGNTNFMKSHEATMHSPMLEGFEDDLRPVIADHLSDTGALDTVMELLVRAGHDAPLAKQILIPPAWSMSHGVPQAHQDMFVCLNTICEPWDGPAAIAATDGQWIMAGMDRGGLRPMRYAITQKGLLLVGSESGMVPFDEKDVLEKGRLGPGECIAIHLGEGVLLKDRALKDRLAAQHPYAQWRDQIRSMSAQDLSLTLINRYISDEKLRCLQHAVGMTFEEVETIISPMAEDAKEAVGSMGDDAPLAVLSAMPRGFHHFFRQNFSQVTNPPIDSLRERRVMSLFTRFGNDGNFLALNNSYQGSLLLESPVLLTHELETLKHSFLDRITVIPALFDATGCENALRKGLDYIVREAEKAVLSGKPYIILTDEHQDENHAAIPMILATAAINSHLVKRKMRKRASILVRSAECCDVHHLAVLIGVGATVVNPYLAEELILQRQHNGLLGALTARDSLYRLKEALEQGLLKIMSKMGISVVSSYRNGYNFEAIGLSRSVVAEFFPGLPSRLSGIGLKGLEQRVLKLHKKAFNAPSTEPLPIGGFYKIRAGQERHALEGIMIHTLQSAVEKGSYATYRKYTQIVYEQAPVSIRHLLDFRPEKKPIDIGQVESVTDIRKRFCAPAMSLGALSPEAHETLAIAMNRMGAMSNSGEGGEGAERFKPRANGDNANSSVKQVASARFGVTAKYLNSCNEIQIKIAQGAKPGEGGQLPGFKVTAEIARLRHATEGVMLISPPPHHDIYSIEDLAQLIYDLKQINPDAIVSVKLVSQAGIGTIASGVAKAMADKIVVAGHSGGTGASPYSSIKFAGSPWEMGLAEVNQVLTLNRMRHRVKLQTDGGIKTGRDVVIAAMLGAEEFAVGTASLVAMGCILVRQCHSNTCPVGICSQDPEMRKKFEGTVEKVVNLFSFIAEEVREILASLGVETLDEIVGRSDLLAQVDRGDNDLDLNPILARADNGFHANIYSLNGRNEVTPALDEQMLADAKDAIIKGEKVQLAYSVRNTHRSVGARLSSMLTRHFDTDNLPEDHLTIRLRGTAGQSLGVFLVRGIKIELLGDANDYVGKGLSGGLITVRPRPSSLLVAHDNTIIGNTVLYGATSGELFASGQAGERFAVRNSGANAVVEGCGSNGCEYMTGGTVVILGAVGDNFAAGMTGGMAYIYDPEDQLKYRTNHDNVLLQSVQGSHWEAQLKSLIERHHHFTESLKARDILINWTHERVNFKQVVPKEMVDRLAYPLVDEGFGFQATGSKNPAHF